MPTETEAESDDVINPPKENGRWDMTAIPKALGMWTKNLVYCLYNIITFFTLLGKNSAESYDNHILFL